MYKKMKDRWYVSVRMSPGVYHVKGLMTRDWYVVKREKFKDGIFRWNVVIGNIVWTRRTKAEALALIEGCEQLEVRE